VEFEGFTVELSGFIVGFCTLANVFFGFFIDFFVALIVFFAALGGVVVFLTFLAVSREDFFVDGAFLIDVLLALRLVAGFWKVFLIAIVFFEAVEAAFWDFDAFFTVFKLVFTIPFLLDDVARSRAAGFTADFTMTLFEEAGFFEELFCVFFIVDLAAPFFMVPPLIKIGL
jgi:hypothetical protein